MIPDGHQGAVRFRPREQVSIIKNITVMTKRKTTSKKAPSHALFWTLLKRTPGYDERYREVIKEGVVDSYSGGRTSSLSEMYRKYPAEYSLMIEKMKKSVPGGKRAIYDEDLDNERKRVIAVICAGVDKRGLTFPSDEDKLAYVKRVACRAANCGYFNAIPLSRMRAIYNDWNKKNKVDVNGRPELDYAITGN